MVDVVQAKRAEAQAYAIANAKSFAVKYGDFIALATVLFASIGACVI
jgi:hypothetical protein